MANQTAPSEIRFPGALATLGLILASIGFGLIPYFARSLTTDGMAPAAVAFYRYAFTALALSPFLRVPRAQRPVLLWGLGAGVVMGLGWIGYVRALALAPVSSVGVLYMTYPIFTLGLGWALFGDRPTRRGVLAAVMILGAAVIAAAPAAVSPAQLPALLISLAAPASFGLGINVLVHRLVRLPPLTRIASVSLGSVIGLAPLILTTAPAAVLPQGPSALALVLGIALIGALVPQLLYTICAPMVGAARTAMAGAVELPTLFATGWLAFGEPVGLAQWVACALIVAAIVLTPGRALRNAAAGARAP
jgi:drug/metabolite transporter (DMT)-like permease